MPCTDVPQAHSSTTQLAASSCQNAPCFVRQAGSEAAQTSRSAQSWWLALMAKNKRGCRGIGNRKKRKISLAPEWDSPGSYAPGGWQQSPGAAGRRLRGAEQLLNPTAEVGTVQSCFVRALCLSCAGAVRSQLRWCAKRRRRSCRAQARPLWQQHASCWQPCRRGDPLELGCSSLVAITSQAVFFQRGCATQAQAATLQTRAAQLQTEADAAAQVR